MPRVRLVDAGAALALPPPLPPEPPPPSSSLLPTLPGRDERQLIALLQRRAERARTDSVTFFSFCMREERTHRRIVCAPHQRLFLAFVDAFDRCVIRMPIGTSKTFLTVALTLQYLGRDATERGAIISASQGQAQKPLSMVQDYIADENGRYPELHLVFPHLAPSPRPKDPWTQTKITVDRPPGIRDPSLVAIGIDGKLPGSRLSWVVVDDILDMQNTATPANRASTNRWFNSTVLSRRDVEKSKIVVTNTPWHPEDLTYQLEKQGWPTLTMSVDGEVTIVNAPDFDSSEIRRSAFCRQGQETLRLTAHDSPEHTSTRVISLPSGELKEAPEGTPGAVSLDLHDEVPLWPAKYSVEAIEKLRLQYAANPVEFNQLYKCKARDDASAPVKAAWFQLAKDMAISAGFFSLVTEYRGPNLTVTGVDLALGEDAKHDYTAYFTFEVIPAIDVILRDGAKKTLRNARRILDVEFGRFKGRTVVDKLIDKVTRYGSIARVETNACFVLGTRVLTREGYVPIEQVAEGAEVWTHRARWRRVLHVLRGESEVMCRPRVKGCLPIETTANHWFWMRQAGRVSGRKGGHHVPVGDPRWISVGFSEREAYAAVAVPRWEPARAVLRLGLREVEVDERLALLLGLYMAEGHSTQGQVTFTLSRKEPHLVDFLKTTLQGLLPGARISTRNGDGTTRVVANSTALANELRRFGKSSTKRPPIEWYGWPLAVRLAMVRGWLMGDGCVRTNNRKTHPRPFMSGSSISRDWILFGRTALLEAGYRPALSLSDRRGVSSFINGRPIYKRHPSIGLALNAEDSARLQAEMTTDVEREHWPTLPCVRRRSGAAVVHDGEHAWSWLRDLNPDHFERKRTEVFNLVVEEDESFTVEDVIVHNAQDFLRQWVLDTDASIPVRAHTTGQNKHHRTFGVAGLFIELENGAWLIPCDPTTGLVHPHVQRWIDECLDYQPPPAHTGDVLMASWLARAQAKELDFGGGGDGTQGQGSLVAGISAR